MKKDKLYSWLSAVAGLIGIGMIFGYSFAEGTSSTPLWMGGILVLLGAVMFGMTISLKSSRANKENNAKDT